MSGSANVLRPSIELATKSGPLGPCGGTSAVEGKADIGLHMGAQAR